MTMYVHRDAIERLGVDLQMHNQSHTSSFTTRQFAKSRHARPSFVALSMNMTWLLSKFEKFKPSFWAAGVGLLVLRLLQTSLMAIVRTQRVQAAIVCVLTLIAVSVLQELSPMQRDSDSRIAVLSQQLIFAWVFVLSLRIAGLFQRPLAAWIIGTTLCGASVGLLMTALFLANEDRCRQQLGEEQTGVQNDTQIDGDTSAERAPNSDVEVELEIHSASKSLAKCK